jgi:plasmid stabilization system protein ParE
LAQLIWTPNALRDVQRLYRFLLPSNPDAARRAIATIRKDVGKLVNQPRMGRHSEDVDQAFREILIAFGSSGYVALYHLGDDGAVTILAIRHQKEAGY